VTDRSIPKDPYSEEVGEVIDKMSAIATGRDIGVILDAVVYLLASAIIHKSDTLDEAEHNTGVAGHRVCDAVSENWQRIKDRPYVH
jgi:hypothetical protein